MADSVPAEKFNKCRRIPTSIVAQVYVEGILIGDCVCNKMQIRFAGCVTGNLQCSSLGMDPSVVLKVTASAEHASMCARVNIASLCDSKRAKRRIICMCNVWIYCTGKTRGYDTPASRSQRYVVRTRINIVDASRYDITQ